MNYKNSFCTIATKDYLSWSLSLYDSLFQFNKDIILNVLITDINTVSEIETRYPKNVKVFTIKDIQCIEIVKKLENKYKTTPNVLRWSLKPAFISFLLKDFEKVIFSDSDIFYFNNYQFLFDELNKNNLLLSPHWRSKDPEIDKPNFDLLFKGGLFNGGFVAANKNAKEILQFWAKNCLEVCELNLAKGQFADQTHLNLLPIYFEKVKILKHRGCNVANWNQVECKRTIAEGTTEVLINNKQPIVFIHFTKSTSMGILRGSDQLLMPYFEKYNTRLVKNGFENLKEKYIAEIQKQEFKSKSKKKDSLVRKVIKKIKNSFK